MSETAIEWTQRTWNPIVGCSLESPGCTNCYAMKMAGRLEAMGVPAYQGTTMKAKTGFVWTGKISVQESVMLEPLRRKKPTTYFVNSMSDLFHPDVPDEVIDRVFAVMALCPQHTFQVLTKRSARMRAYLSGEWFGFRIRNAMQELHPQPIIEMVSPLPNVWLGVSVEDQKRADERIPDLLATPAAVRFLSMEPLLGPVDLESAWHGENALDSECWGDCAWCAKGYPPLHNCSAGRQSDAVLDKGRSGLDWVIAGGESGPGARPMHPDWARSLRDQCAEAGVPFFFKQWGDWREWDDGSGIPEPEEVENDSETADAIYASAIRPAFISHDGRVFSRRKLPVDEPCRLVERVGKKRAGRLLDGVEHNGMPS
jgi:protein gp37